MPEEIDPPADNTGTDIPVVYSKTVIDHATKPRNMGPIEQPDGYATITGPCGDTMQIWFRVRDDLIIAATFMTDGCGPSIASGSIATELVKRKAAADAIRISHKDILNALDGLPEDSRHCALLAANTIKAAIRDYIAFKSEPWKRAYVK
ncbi:MAG: iron-sulfur cluster assembly scaffold protein [Chloroflexota bacterium]|nr:iron-sulfur cluster assembly scaffold protein [Chloroflexota bacterium]